MILNTKIHNAVKVLSLLHVYRSRNISRGRRLSVADIAHMLPGSKSCIEQLVAPMVRAGVLQGFRGPGGGYELKKSLLDITLCDLNLAYYSGMGAMGGLDRITVGEIIGLRHEANAA